MAVPFWDTFTETYEEWQDRNTNPWDILHLNSERVPGIAEVKVTPHMVIDIKKTTSFDGGPTIELGHQAAKLDIAVTIWTPAQWEGVQGIMAKIWRLPGREQKGSKPRERTRRAAVSISHPNCAFLGISAVLLEAPEGLQPATGLIGAKTLRLRAVQYIPPSAKPATRKAAGQGGRIQVGVVNEFVDFLSGIPRRPPSQTDAVALPGPGPAQGSS